MTKQQKKMEAKLAHIKKYGLSEEQLQRRNLSKILAKERLKKSRQRNARKAKAYAKRLEWLGYRWRNRNKPIISNEPTELEIANMLMEPYEGGYTVDDVLNREDMEIVPSSYKRDREEAELVEDKPQNIALPDDWEEI